MGELHMGGGISFAALLDTTIKASLLVGMVMLLGAGLFRRWVGRELASAPAPRGLGDRRLRTVAVAGAVLLLVFSPVHMALALRDTLGYVDLPLLIAYAGSTTHGRASLVRMALALLLAALACLPRSRLDDALVALASVAALATFSIVSHNATAGGWLPLLADLVHFAATVAWAGAILLVAVLPVWQEAARERLEPALHRISAVGLGAVAVLTVSGIYTALLHLRAPAQLVTTLYGESLLFKLAVVLVILGVAAYNRMQMLPDFLAQRDTASLGRAIRVEAVLLLVVLVTTGLLTTTSTPA